MCGRSCAHSGAALSTTDRASACSRGCWRLTFTPVLLRSACAPMIRSSARINHETVHVMPASQRPLSSFTPHPLEMSERDILAQWLGRAAWRLRLDVFVRETAAMVCWVLCATVLYQAIRLLLGVHEVLAALLPLFLLGSAALVVLFTWRLSRLPTLQQVAAAADRRAN